MQAVRFGKTFWTGYVTTAQADAGNYLGATPNNTRYAREQSAGHISDRYRPIILNYTDKSWNWDWSTKSTTVVKPPQRANEETKPSTHKEQEERRANRAKMMGVITAAIGAFGVGYFYKQYTRQNETMRYVLSVQKEGLNALPEGPLKEALKQLIKHQVAIDTLNSSKINSRLYSAVSVLAGGSALALGGFASIPWLITVGQVTLVASAIFTLGNVGLHWHDGEEVRGHYIAILGDADKRVQGWVDHTLMILSCLAEDLNAAEESPPPYSEEVRLYPGYYQADWREPSAPPPYSQRGDEI